MPVNLTYPGVYIEEVPSGVRTITGVSTSVTAFIGRALKGPIDKAMLIHNFSEFERIYGGLWKESYLAYVVDQYFNNGGKDAVIIRVIGVPTNSTEEKCKAEYSINITDTNIKIILQSATPGSWAKNFSIKIVTKKEECDEELRKIDKTLCTLYIYEDKRIGNEDKKLLLENFRNISLKESSSRFVTPILEFGSELVRIVKIEGVDENAVIPDDKEFTSITTPNQGGDGKPITAKDIQGTANPNRGLFLLDYVDIFNLLCIPSFRVDDSPEPDAVITDLVAMYDGARKFCEKQRAFLIVDPLVRWTDKNQAIKDSNNNTFPSPKNKNMAIFFPRITYPDKENENRPRNFPPCGVIAGVMARTDTERGIWKAPAGLDATLNGVVGLTVKLNDEENGDLNKLGINCLRTFFGGPVVWGSRTLRGDDRFADEWKYVPVRRTALFIEESLYRGTQWVVFEPNDEKLWSQIRLNVGAFMQDLFIKGAFQGTDPKKAYFVKCDSETTTQTDIDRGIVNIVVGFAPLKPAEFVVIKIQQITHTEASV
ncbi:MAG: phage tail sheath family protein [Nitrososphaeraceae archaeon]